MQTAPGPDPLEVLAQWHREALAAGAREPDAMTLATATPEGRPSARVVLFKGFSRGALQFVSNYQSRKARELEQNSRVALVFFWPELMRQVRVEGRAERAPSGESDTYFRSRPRESQLGAWASSQSEPVASRSELEQRFRDAQARFLEREVERPPSWGIYRVEADAVELWSSAPHRLHDRFFYERAGAAWNVVRLCP
jgi:pyridoxamine 5'-phosphate oxidase